MFVQKRQGVVDRESRIAFRNGNVRDAIVKDVVVPFRAAMIPGQLGVEIYILRTRLDSSTQSGVVTRSFDPMVLPPELFQLVTAFNVPFSKISRRISSRRQVLGPVRFLRPEYTLIRIPAVLDFEDTVIVRQKACHQRGP